MRLLVSGKRSWARAVGRVRAARIGWLWPRAATTPRSLTGFLERVKSLTHCDNHVRPNVEQGTQKAPAHTGRRLRRSRELPETAPLVAAVTPHEQDRKHHGPRAEHEQRQRIRRIRHQRRHDKVTGAPRRNERRHDLRKRRCVLRVEKHAARHRQRQERDTVEDQRAGQTHEITHGQPHEREHDRRDQQTPPRPTEPARSVRSRR